MAVMVTSQACLLPYVENGENELLPPKASRWVVSQPEGDQDLHLLCMRSLSLPSPPGRGRYLVALGHAYHPEEFVCSQCGKVLEEGGFFEEKGAIFCPPCYDVRYAPSCAKCNKKITGVSRAGWRGGGPKPVSGKESCWATLKLGVSPSEPSGSLPAYIGCCTGLTLH